MIDLNQERNKRLISWLRGKPAPPLSVELSPTLRCNLNCQFCWRYEEKELDFSNEMPDEKYFELIEEGYKLGVLEWKIIGGGEATVRKGFIIKLMKEIKAKGMTGYLCTNGLAFDETSIKEIVECEFDHIKFSFESSYPEIHDQLVEQKGAFEKATRNMRIFSKYKKLLGKNKPFTEIGMVLTNLNHREMPQMVKLCAELGINALFIEPITVYSTRGESLKLDEKGFEEFSISAREGIKMAKKYGIFTNLGTFSDATYIKNTSQMDKVICSPLVEKKEQGFLAAKCFEPWYRMGIRVDGQVGPCGFYDPNSPEYITKKSLAEIWFGPYFERKRREFLTDRLSPQCKKCCVTLVENNRRIRQELKAIIQSDNDLYIGLKN